MQSVWENHETFPPQTIFNIQYQPILCDIIQLHFKNMVNVARVIIIYHDPLKEASE